MSYKDSLIGKIIWTVIRVWLGWQWLSSGWGKVYGAGSDVWVGSRAGTAIGGFLSGALTKTTGTHPDVQTWYAWFIQNVALPNAKIFSYIIAYGEVVVGIALIIGFLTVPALLAGILMNLNYLLAGAVSTNPILMALAVILLFIGAPAWYFGVDRLFWPRYRRWRTDRIRT